MFKVEMLPAGHGDCLWIEYGPEDSPSRLLIDGGTTGTHSRLKKRMEQVPREQHGFELLVVTHIDGDHIAGVLKLLEDETLSVSFDDIWFNGYRHLPKPPLEPLGPEQGEQLTDWLVKPELSWNKTFDSDAVAVSESGLLPEKWLPGGMKLTLLSPTIEKLADLRPVWKKVVREAGLDPEAPRLEEEDQDTRPSGLERLGAAKLPDVEALASVPFEEDGSEANGTSIVLLAEYGGHSILLCADAHADVINASLDKLNAQRGLDSLPLDAVKLPHHGSKANVSAESLEKIDCHHYLVSTNGAYFKHPDDIAIARIIKYGGPNPHLCFNYLSKYNELWSNRSLQNTYSYSVDYPANVGESLVISLE